MRALALFISLLGYQPFLWANTFGTTGALMGAHAATNQLDISWTPQWSNLKAYYRFDGKLGALASADVVPDLFGTSNATTTAAGMSYAAGKLEQGLTFNGTANLTIPRTSPANVCTSVTIMMWVKWNATTATSWAALAGNYNPSACTDYGWYIQQHSNTKTMEFSINTSGNLNQADPTIANVFDGTWRHVAITISSSQALIYVDGVLDKTISIIMGGGVCSPTAPLNFGGPMCDTRVPSGAMIDEFAIFNAILTAPEISTIYNRQKNGIQ
ncbi:LamG domain-containing protein [Bdellovibrio sp. HCB185ZH]|uniref:LamG domain-containing protein n=1 Tax=Bdellovibrio sp. HCB185ZH TaxID=3394235 RepID=UPI0039A68792